MPQPQADTAAPLVSILVPIYNVERYLEQCLASICAQTLKNIEIICINDGSTDTSLSILQKWAKSDPRMRIIDKPNSGYGHSMNRGLEQARGEYIGIVESDDYVDPQMFELLYQAAIEQEAQIVKADFYLTWTEPKLNETYFDAVPKALAGTVVVPWQEYSVMQPQPSIWSALYQRSFLKHYTINFLESPGAAFQDTSFNYAAWSAANRVYLLKRALIHYRQDNAGSSINTNTKTHAILAEIDRYFAWLDTLDGLDDLAERKYALKRIMQGIVYKTFRWNLERIAPSQREDFLNSLYDYFIQARDEGLLDPQYFEFNFYDEVLLLLNNPKTYLQVVVGTTLRCKFKRLVYYLKHDGIKATLKRVFHA